MLNPHWDEMPRAFGNPGQFIVYDYGYLQQLIKENNGINPVYISHNSYPHIDRLGEPLDVNVTKIIKDLDNEEKPENALLDLRKLVRHAIKNNIPHGGNFSGGKGYHFHHFLKPETYDVSQDLEEAIRAVQLWWQGLGRWDGKHYATELRNDDEKVIGDWRRLIRVWGSQYAKFDQSTRTSTPKDTHCIPLTDEMILEWNHEQIVEFSKKPRRVKMDYSGDEFTLKEFIKNFSVKRPEHKMAKMNFGDGRIIDFTDREDEVIRKMFVEDCLYNQMMSDNPTHSARFAIAVYCKEVLGMGQEQIFNLFKSRNWVDSHREKVCIYQIKHIFKKGYTRSKDRRKMCQWLARRDLCVGDRCRFYKKYVEPWIKDGDYWESEMNE